MIRQHLTASDDTQYFEKDHILVTVSVEDILEGRIRSTRVLSGGEEILMKITSLEARDSKLRPNVECLGAEIGDDAFYFIDQSLFLVAIDDGRIKLRTLPLFVVGAEYVNRFTLLREKVIAVSPRRDTKTGQYQYMIESERNMSVSYEMLPESTFLRRYDALDSIQEGNDTP